MQYDSPESYLPHRSPMVLLDTVVSVSDYSACCEVTVSPDGVLARYLDENHNLPSWYAIELLAQTVGVWSGWHQQRTNTQKPEMGLLLSGRSLKSEIPYFKVGSKLSIRIHLQLQDNNIGNFEGEISLEGHMLVCGRLTTYQPTFDELETLFGLN